MLCELVLLLNLHHEFVEIPKCIKDQEYQLLIVIDVSHFDTYEQYLFLTH